ncbi:hypothetical protein [Pseudomonas fluorescens]|uniref:Uncharacterized protein n=1 Tax=Pseudomonas fluorescens TaxID=294 RepID=A0A0F4T6E9_PSEFL|nr:hypothetical protein [Pseudomonas fluorescens]KJZ38947.1 hypothetical protein VC34_22790 [Pseudomonas fluorescens]
MNNAEKADYLHEGIRDLEAAIRNNHPLIGPKKHSLRTRLKMVLDGTRGSDIYDDLADSLIPIKGGFKGEDLAIIADAIKACRTPSLVDVFKAKLLERAMGL